MWHCARAYPTCPIERSKVVELQRTISRTLPLLPYLAILAIPCWASADQPLLIRHPTVSADKIAFCYAGDIWTVSRDGGDAQRLTAGVGHKCAPYFSPDGKWITFTADYYGTPDVFVIPSTGGEPKRLTWHPAGSAAAGWSPDSKSVLFASTRTSSTDRSQTLARLNEAAGAADATRRQR